MSRKIKSIILALTVFVSTISQGINANALEKNNNTVSANSQTVKKEKSGNEEITNLNKVEWESTEKLLKILKEKKKGENIIISPTSLYIALSMLRDKNLNDENLNKFLGLNNKDDLSLEISKLNQILNNKNNESNNKSEYTDETINKNLVFYNESKPLEEGYKKVLLEKYNAEVKDFKSDKKGAEEANIYFEKWVKDNTKGFLNLKGNIEPLTEFQLINLLYLNSKWVSPFKVSTEDLEFKLDKDSVKKVKSMEKEKVDKYVFEGENLRGYYELTNEGSKIWFILPKEDKKDSDIKEISKMISFHEDGDALKDNGIISKEMRLTVKMPKVNLEDELQLKNLIEEASGGRIDVTEIIQNVKVDLNEEGVKVAAVTRVGKAMSARPKELEEISLIFDKPYYIVVEKESNPMFFMSIEKP